MRLYLIYVFTYGLKKFAWQVWAFMSGEFSLSLKSGMVSHLHQYIIDWAPKQPSTVAFIIAKPNYDGIAWLTSSRTPLLHETLLPSIVEEIPSVICNFDRVLASYITALVFLAFYTHGLIRNILQYLSLKYFSNALWHIIRSHPITSLFWCHLLETAATQIQYLWHGRSPRGVYKWAQ